MYPALLIFPNPTLHPALSVYLSVSRFDKLLTHFCFTHPLFFHICLHLNLTICFMNHTSIKELNHHLLFVHLRKEMDGERFDDFMDTCLSVLPCRLCIQNHLTNKLKYPIQDCFYCCLNDFLFHAENKDIHSATALISLLISLKKEFLNNQRVLKLINDLFFVECPTCSFLSENYRHV